MNQAFLTGPSTKELLKVDKLLDRIESEMKKKRAENFYASPDKYVNYMNKTTELYTLISEEVMSFLDIIGLSDYISTFKKLFRGMQQQIQSMLKFTLHHYNLKNLQIKESQAAEKHPTIRIGDGITSPTVSFAMKVQKNILGSQADQSQPNSAVYSALGLTSPKYPFEDHVKLNHAVDSIPSLLITDDRKRPDSGRNRSSCPPIARKNGIDNMTAEQENEFELEAYRRDAERIQMEIDGILESKDSVLKIQPTTLQANLKQILRSLEVTKRHTRVELDESSDEELEDDVDFEKMVKKLMEACSGAQKKLFQKIVGYMEAKRVSEQKTKQDQETMPDPKILEAGEKLTKKQLDQAKKDIVAMKEKADGLAQEKLFNEEKYTVLMKKHTTCDEDKKKLVQQIAQLEGEIAGLRAAAEEMKIMKSKQNSARSLVDVGTPSTAKFNQEVHEKLVEQLKEYKAEIEALRSENRDKYNNSVKRSSIHSNTNRQKSVKHGGSMSSNRLMQVQAEDEEYSPDNSFTNKKDVNEDLEGFTDRGSYPSQIDKSEPAASRTQLGKSRTQIQSMKSISIPPGMNAPRKNGNGDVYEDEEGGYTGSKEEPVELLYESGNKNTAGRVQALEIEKAKKERMKSLALESFGDKSKSTEDETQQTVRRKFMKDRTPTDKSGGNKSSFMKESSPKKKQQAPGGSASPRNAREDDRSTPKKAREDGRSSSKRATKNAVSRFEASSQAQETTFSKNSMVKENSGDVADTSPKNAKQQKNIQFSSQNTKHSINSNDEVNTMVNQVEVKSPQVRIKKSLKEDEKRMYKETNDYDQREPKSMLLADKKSRIVSMSVDKSIQTDDEFSKVYTAKESIFKKEDDKEGSNLISPRQKSTTNSIANKSLSKLMKDVNRDAQMMRTTSGPKLTSMSYMNESTKIKDKVRQSLMMSFDMKQKLQTLKYEDNETSKYVSTRMKERIPTDLIDQSIEKIDDASDFMSPTYSSVTAKGEDAKAKYVNLHNFEKNKTRTASTFSPARTIDDNNMSPLVNYEDSQMAVMYNAMLTKAEQDPKILQALKNFLKEKGEVVDDENFVPQYDDFVEFVSDFRKLHQRCGDNCSHLQRFYARIGYYHIWNKRAPLAMKKPSLVASSSKGRTAMKLPNIPEKKVLKMAS